ncbi:MAG: hypothetical protein NTV33_10935 [Coprothermobacterota bacterium]|nr:hypothetical protein [Coprothermobacterota bacterium]
MPSLPGSDHSHRRLLLLAPPDRKKRLDATKGATKNAFITKQDLLITLFITLTAIFMFIIGYLVGAATFTQQVSAATETVLSASAPQAITPDRDQFIVSARVVGSTRVEYGDKAIPAFEGAVITSDRFLEEGTIIFWEEMARLGGSLGIVVDHNGEATLSEKPSRNGYVGDDYTRFRFDYYKTEWGDNPETLVFLKEHTWQNGMLTIAQVVRYGYEGELTEFGQSLVEKWQDEINALDCNADDYWNQREATSEGAG